MLAHSVWDHLRRGKTLAAPFAAEDPSRSGWIGIYPLDLSKPTTQAFLSSRGVAALPSAGPAFHIRTFEVDRASLDADKWLSEDDLRNARSYFAFGEDDLLAKLDALGVPIDALEPPFRSDYPI